ncbi:hypothetical protein [Rhodovulum adriaticum]|uniref:Nickel transport protein n=1 Tax=Rhodovulum adriaticum TaxID=35804 RepID=A0A4R2NIJ0_RHOAD|nr:hypothetical protein [Rhodovulum adriaticum]TCP20924.1 hypothetical protein EV656_11545 [Rhodovulum adriaticum]
MRISTISTLSLAAALISFGGLAQAHTPLCACYDNGDGTVLCEGGFSDGSSAAGVRMAVRDGDGNILIDAKMDENSEFTFDKPAGAFSVLFDAGEGHTIEVPADEIY